METERELPQSNKKLNFDWIKRIKLKKGKSEKTEKPKSTEKSPKLKKRLIIAGIAVTIVVVGLFALRRVGEARLASALTMDETAFVETMDLKSQISATGTVISVDTNNIYSTQSYTIQEVYVSVGDKVNEGDPLCKLDSKTLEDQIEKKELSMGITAQAAAQQIKTARDQYKSAQSALEADMNQSLVSAQAQVDTALNNYEKAQKAYDEYRATLNYNENAQILQLESQLNSARTARDNAYTAMVNAQNELSSLTTPSQADINQAGQDVVAAQVARDQAKLAYEAALVASPTDPAVPGLSRVYYAAEAAVEAANMKLSGLMSAQSTNTAKQEAYNAKRDAYNASVENYDLISKQLDAAYRSANNTLTDYAKNVDIAYESYQNALTALSATERTVDSQLQQNKNSLSSTQIQANEDLSILELAQMKEELEKTTVKATKSGTVTAVYAKVGNQGSGLLFIIEDTENLKIETTVKEYDMGTVKVGANVIIKSDATGEEEIQGAISNISPASRKTQTGAIDTAGDIVFPAEVEVLSQNTGLRIGMSTRLNFIIEQKENVMAVPYESIYENDEGDTCILIVEDAGEGKYLIKEQKVTTYLETDLYIEVEGDGLAAGMRVINTAESFTHLVDQTVFIAEVRETSGLSGPFVMSRQGG